MGNSIFWRKEKAYSFPILFKTPPLQQYPYFNRDLQDRPEGQSRNTIYQGYAGLTELRWHAPAELIKKTACKKTGC
jgi:hypothetical protein